MGELPRRFVRRPVAVEFRVQENEDGESGELLFDTVDVSEGGAFLRSDLLLQPGDELDVSFTLPGTGTTIQTRARVAWVAHRRDVKGDAGMGLEFVSLSERDRAAIVEFIRASPQGA